MAKLETIATIAAAVAVKHYAEKKVGRDQTLTEEEKSEAVIKSTAAAIGGGAGYTSGKYITDNANRTYSLMNRAVCTAIGAFVGYWTGKGISHYVNSSTEKKP